MNAPNLGLFPSTGYNGIRVFSLQMHSLEFCLLFAWSCKQSLTTRYETPEYLLSGLTNRIIGATRL